MKTVFRSEEIAHVWAHASAPYGRSPGNLSFDGDAIKSYATVIGRRIRHKGKTAFVLDRASFSNSTGKSQGRVRDAIPETEKVFSIRNGSRGQSLNFTPATLAKWFEDRAAEIMDRAPSRYAHKRAEQWREATAAYESAREVLAYFDMGTARLSKKLAERAGKAGEADAILKARAVQLAAADKARKARELKERTARNIAGAEKYIAGGIEPLRWFDLEGHAAALATLPDDLRRCFVAAVEAGNARLVADWRKGVDVSFPRDAGTFLRTEGEGNDAEMVTSKGARVPLKDARRTYRFAMLARAKGWHKNGETHQIGSYQLDSVNEQGVIAGCHRVTWAEIEAFAALMGWAGGAK